MARFTQQKPLYTDDELLVYVLQITKCIQTNTLFKKQVSMF